MSERQWKYESFGNVRTDGVVWQVQNDYSLSVSGPLKDFIERLQEELKNYPDAEVKLTANDDYVRLVITWWEAVPEDHPDVQRYIEKEKKAAERHKEQEERDIANLRRTRPELFKDIGDQHQNVLLNEHALRKEQP